MVIQLKVRRKMSVTEFGVSSQLMMVGKREIYLLALGPLWAVPQESRAKMHAPEWDSVPEEMLGRVA